MFAHSDFQISALIANSLKAKMLFVKGNNSSNRSNNINIITLVEYTSEASLAHLTLALPLCLSWSCSVG